ncbi:MAG: carbohydrate ABC transporter permease [Candidatus Izemoplasmatales bacterium]
MSKFTTFKEQKWPHIRHILLGGGYTKGLLYKIAIYFLSITFAFVFLYPIFYMFMISLMSNTDLVDSTILWIPSSIYIDNYLISGRAMLMNQLYIFYFIDFMKSVDITASLADAYVMSTPLLTELVKVFTILMIIPVSTAIGSIFTKNYKKIWWISAIAVVVILFLPRSYVDSFYVAGTTTMMMIVSSAVIGYGLSRFNFIGKKFIFIMLLLIYILPKTLLFIPRAEIFNLLGVKGTIFALWVPALLGQGIQATFFILVFFQFFRMIPKQIEEAAYIDGANSFNIFMKIALPTAVPAFIIAITYGFAVNWNEVFLSNFYLDGNIKTIPMLLGSLQAEWGRYADYATGDGINIDFTESKAFAGTLLSIIPLVVAYGVIQKYFIESIDKSGITGE